MKDTKLSQAIMNKNISANIIFCIVCIAALFITGCSRYQYVLIDSDLYKNDNKEFIDENDTLMMKYNFTGTDFPITITVFNKLNQPLYIDLSKSSVIMNDTKIEDAFNRDDQTDSIAPQSFATIKSNNLSDKFIPLSSQDKKTSVMVPTSYGSNQVKLHSFDQETSPVFFRSLLTFSTQKDYSSPMYYDHPFWVSGIFQTFDVTYSNSPSNQFYMEKTTGFATFMGYLGAALLLVGIAAVTPQEQ